MPPPQTSRTFISANKVWFIGANRNRTRRACVEVLNRLPESVRREIIDRHRVLVIAPATGVAAHLMPYRLKSNVSETEPRFQVVTLGAALEKVPSWLAIALIVKCIAAAMAEDGGPSPEGLAYSWGFTEVRRTRITESVAKRIAGAEELPE